MEQEPLFRPAIRRLHLHAGWDYPTGWKWGLTALREGADELWAPVGWNQGLATPELLEESVDGLYGLLGDR